jgi:hypothetical protein
MFSWEVGSGIRARIGFFFGSSGLGLLVVAVEVGFSTYCSGVWLSGDFELDHLCWVKNDGGIRVVCRSLGFNLGLVRAVFLR